MWLLRFFTYLQLKSAKSNVSEQAQALSVPITVKELKMAENRLLSYEQRTRFPHLVKALKNKERLTSKHCNRSTKKLDPFLEEGILRVGGRLLG